MRVLIITQNEPLFLSPAIDYLLRRVDLDIKIVGAVVTAGSPFGKKESIFKKVYRTVCIFGFRFFVFYSLKFLYAKLFRRDVASMFSSRNIDLIALEGSINSDKSIDILKSLEADLFVSIAGNEVFKKALIEVPKRGILNLHSALLPKYRGLMPTFWALKHSEVRTGVSVFFVDEGIDTGPILVQRSIQLGQISLFELIRATKIMGMEAILDAIRLVKTDQFRLKENEGNDATYFSFPTREDVKEFLRDGNRLF